jgi:hypothetical protein
MTSTRSKDRSESSPANDSGLTPQQVMEMGQAAAQLLNSPIYNAVHQMAVQEVIEAWSATSPKEVNRRESLWQELQALGKVAQKTAELVDRSKELLENQNQAQHNHNQEYLNNQGFGEAPQNFQ